MTCYSMTHHGYSDDMPSVQTSSKWPDNVDSILANDQAVTFAHVTPAHGVVLTPLTNFGVRDREAGTVGSVNSSVGMWLKLDRVRRNPRVAIAFHTREHSSTKRPEYVLVQGTATLSDDWLDSHLEEWERFGGQPRDLNPVWDWWLRVYHDRVGID